MDVASLRLELLKTIYPHASVASIKDPASIIGIAKELEEYVYPAASRPGRKPRAQGQIEGQPEGPASDL